MEIDFAVHFGVKAYTLNKKKKSVENSVLQCALSVNDVEYFNSVSVLSV